MPRTIRLVKSPVTTAGVPHERSRYAHEPACPCRRPCRHRAVGECRPPDGIGHEPVHVRSGRRHAGRDVRPRQRRAEGRRSAEAGAAAATRAPAAAATRSAGSATSAFTYDALGATPHVELRKQPARSEVQAPARAAALQRPRRRADLGQGARRRAPRPATEGARTSPPACGMGGDMRGGWLACVAIAAALAGCGAPDETVQRRGTTSSAWIQTDLAGADLDGDGRTDIVTIATLQQSFGVSDGTLKIYRQTTPGSFVAYDDPGRQLPVAAEDQRRQRRRRARPAGARRDRRLGRQRRRAVPAAAGRRTTAAASSRRRVVASGLSANDFVVTDANLDVAPDIVTAGVPGGGDGAAQYLQSARARGTFEAPSVLNLAGRVAARRGGRRRRFRARWTWSPIRSSTRARPRTRRGSWSWRTRPCSTRPARRRST